LGYSGNCGSLEPITGRIYPHPVLKREAVQATINRQKLDDAGNREMRTRHYQEYCESEYTADFLRKRSPFVR